MALTYDSIASTTLGSAQATVTFSSIPSTYTDLILIITAKDGRSATYGGANVTFNSDTGTNYSITNLYGDGTTAGSSRTTSASSINLLIAGATASNFGITINHIMNYSNSTTNKTLISRGNTVESFTNARVGLWRSTAAITRIDCTAEIGNFASNSTFTLFGIKSA